MCLEVGFVVCPDPSTAPREGIRTNRHGVSFDGVKDRWRYTAVWCVRYIALLMCAGIAHAQSASTSPPRKPSTVAMPSTASGPPNTPVGPPRAVVGPPSTVVGPPSTVVGPPRAVVGPPNTVVGPPRAVVGPPNTVVGPPNTVVGPPPAVVGPPNAVVGPPNTAVGPPSTVVGPPNAVVGPPGAVGALPPGAIGNSPRFGGTPVFETLDANQDGYVNAREANANREAALAFSRMDTDHDGSISPAEFRATFTSPTSR